MSNLTIKKYTPNHYEVYSDGERVGTLHLVQYGLTEFHVGWVAYDNEDNVLDGYAHETREECLKSCFL